ncbi:MAG TPA: hypothetical protein VGY77_12495 [Gemmataceae bacterium]|nr:hypothetical protein [Gemmataceae bacterium]
MVPEHLMMSTVMVVGQPQEGNGQPDDCRGRQEYKNENQRLIHLRQVQLGYLPLAVPIEANGLAVPCSESNGRQAQSDECAGRDYRSAKCSHR